MSEWDDDDGFDYGLDLVPIPKKTFFEEMKENLNQKCSNLIALIAQRKRALDLKIDELEMEYNNKIKQIEKDKQTMAELREITEQRLGQNTLLDLQNDIIRDIDTKFGKLEAESKIEYNLTLNWNPGRLERLINHINVKLTPKDGAIVTESATEYAAYSTNPSVPSRTSPGSSFDDILGAPPIRYPNAPPRQINFPPLLKNKRKDEIFSFLRD